MNIFAVIAEFNPFHKGHQFLLDEARRLGADCLIVILSGSFVQRGEPALFSKKMRAQTAIEGGADLAVELPLPFSCASAEYFARAGVHLAKALGATHLLFGSECGDIEKLQNAAEVYQAALETPEFFKKINDNGSFPALRQEYFEQTAGKETAALFKGPNNLLGIEYIRAVKAFSSSGEKNGGNLIPVTVLRKTEHDQNMLSSKKLREKIMAGDLALGEWMPEHALKTVQKEVGAGRAVCAEKLEPVLLAVLRKMDTEQIALIADVSEGLENRIFKAAMKAGSRKELIDLIKTKRYTLARIRRILTAALLGITKDDLRVLPPYIRILAANDEGKRILKRAKLPVTASPSKIKSRFPRQVALSAFGEDLLTLCMQTPHPAGEDYRLRIERE